MNAIPLKLTFSFILLSLVAFSLCAQQNRFIYIQTEHKQPFYIKMDKKILSSSASGYIIISKLIDSSYHLSFGFPKNEWPEQKVTIAVKEADAGFLLKNFDEKEWGLFNLQTMKVLMPELKEENNNAVEPELSGDTFSNILSIVVNDPSIRQKKRITVDAMLKDKSHDNTEALLVKLDTPSVDRSKSISIELKPDIKEKGMQSEDQTMGTAEIVKIEISQLKVDAAIDGLHMSYLDKSDLSNDTVTVFIPAADSAGISKVKVQKGKPKKMLKKTETKNKDSRFIDMELPNPNIKTSNHPKTDTTLIIPDKKTAVDVLPMSVKDRNINERDSNGVLINSGCKNFATHDDFLDLRRLMAAENTDDAMKDVAGKKYKTICFTTEQIKNLGVLFIKDEAKYKFYVASYPFVSDLNNFGLLQEELTDNYFITRFKAMLGL